MAYLLGIDTGGTFTDAVVVDDVTLRVVAAAKAPTTHEDLVVGVRQAVFGVLAEPGAPPASTVALVSISTTLATNALVEGHGESAGLIAVGFTLDDLRRGKTLAAVDESHVCVVPGGHDAHGNENCALDLGQLNVEIERVAPLVSAFAVTAQFSVRNAAHEHLVRDLIIELTGLPVTCSSELSARLDGPRRALTSVLNARLLGVISRLNAAVAEVTFEAGVDAPIMVVRGDGSLVSAEFAAARPIETILSGPAASVIGGLHLAGRNDGLVVDIGGTTTDIAVIQDQRPQLASDGAVVGGYRTMVEAVDMATIGLGGDSEIRIDPRAADGLFTIGPERALPIGRLVARWPAILAALQRQLAAPVGLTSHGRFAVAVGKPTAALDQREADIMQRLADGPLTEAQAASSGVAMKALDRLRAQGLVRVATLTPTDAAAVLAAASGSAMPAGVDPLASGLVADVLARQAGVGGRPIASSGQELAEAVVARLVRDSSRFALATALAADGISLGNDGPALIDAALDRRGVAARLDVGLALALTAIGAPAAAYYPAIAAELGVECRVPEYAHVANAVGAVVGHVRVRRSASITQPTKGQFRVHLQDQPTFGSVDRAHEHARALLDFAVAKDAEAAGADQPELHETFVKRTAWVEGKEVFVEGTLTVEATARPRL